MTSALGALRALLIGLSAISLLACHGGGGDDDDDEPELPDDQDAAGLWSGTVSIGGTARSFVIAAAPNGDFTGAIAPTPGATNSRVLVGSGNVTGSSLSASGSAFAPPGGNFPSNTLIAAVAVTNGTVTERASMTGTYSAGGETGPFTLTYNAGVANRGASFARLAGTYSSFPPPTTPGAVNASLNITSTGIADFQTNTGCTGNGTFTIPDAALNLYAFTLTVACPTLPQYTAAGLGVVDDSPSGGTNNRITMSGAPAARDRVFVFIGTK
jgi:hypothetical protein